MKKKVIVRGDRSGVFFGELVERNGRDYGIGMVQLVYLN